MSLPLLGREKMRLLALFLFFLEVVSLPLQQTSLISLRTTETPPSTGGNRILYKPLVLEEWSFSYQLVQNWSLPCSLPDISSLTLTEGLLRSSYPFGEGIWFLCRDVPVGSNLSYTPAPVLIMNLQEDGTLLQWASDSTSYPPGTSTNLVYTWYDSIVQNQVFYTLGGFSTGGPTGQARPAQPRLRMDTGPGTPPDVQGALANIATNVNPTGMSIMTNSLYIPALIPNGTSAPFFSIYQVGTENVLPTSVRSIVSYAVYNEPLMLSVWTFPYIDVVWYTGFNRLPYTARTNFSVTDPSQMTMVFPMPPSSSSGTLGGPTWRVNTARFEGDYTSTGETIYLNNGTTIVKNNVAGLAQGLPYENILQAPPGWKFMDLHARVVLLPSPSASSTASATSTATATSSSSPSSSASATSTSTYTPTFSATPSPTSQPSSTGSPSPSASASAYPSSTATASQDPQRSPEPSLSSSPSSTPSNGTIPIPPPYNAQTDTNVLSPGAEAGIGLASIAALSIAGLLLIQFNPMLKNLWTQKFGQSLKTPKKGVSFRSPVTADVPITIEHNPHVLVQHRLEQLKDLQKQLSMREISHITESNHSLDRTKKEFGPIASSISGESV